MAGLVIELGAVADGFNVVCVAGGCVEEADPAVMREEVAVRVRDGERGVGEGGGGCGVGGG